MQRVLILGCPGTGKTTLSRHLAEITGLPLIHLDYYYHDDQHNYPLNKPAWREQVSKLVASDQWIIEGHYRSTLDLRLPRADTIIYLDYPRRIAVWRMLKRNARYRHKSRPGMPPTWRDTITPQFFAWVWYFNKNNRPLVYEQLTPHQSKKTIIILKRPRDAQSYIQSLRSKSNES